MSWAFENAVGSVAVLPLRGGKAGRVFSDRNLDLLAHLLDDWLHIPGTRIRFGLDALLGLAPGIGDVLGGVASCTLLAAAWFRGVPYITLARMSANIGIEVLGGTVPLIGDAFDLAWRANRRNYKLLTRHCSQPRRHTWKDWGFFLALVGGLATVFVLPLIAVGWAFVAVLHHL